MAETHSRPGPSAWSPSASWTPARSRPGRCLRRRAPRRVPTSRRLPGTPATWPGRSHGPPRAQRIQGLGYRPLAAQRVEGGELARRDLVAGEPGERLEQCVAALAEVVDRAARGGRGVVDLVGEAGRQRAQGDQGVALPDGGLDGPGRAVQAPDQVPGEREPVVHQLAQAGCVQPQHPTGRRAAAGRHVDAVVVPCPEPARPSSGHVHPGHDDVLASHLADQVQRAGEQHPPLVGVLALGEQHVAGLEGHLVAPVRQLGQLVVGHAGEQLDASQLLDVHRCPPRLRPSPGSGVRGRSTSRPHRQRKRPASSTRAARRRRRRRREGWSPVRTACEPAPRSRPRSAPPGR